LLALPYHCPYIVDEMDNSRAMLGEFKHER